MTETLTPWTISREGSALHVALLGSLIIGNRQGWARCRSSHGPQGGPGQCVRRQ